MTGEWQKCGYVNQCYIPELKDYPCGAVLFTYVTLKGKRNVAIGWVERGRLIDCRRIKGTPIAWMPLPEPFKGDTK